MDTQGRGGSAAIVGKCCLQTEALQAGRWTLGAPFRPRMALLWSLTQPQILPALWITHILPNSWGNWNGRDTQEWPHAGMEKLSFLSFLGMLWTLPCLCLVWSSQQGPGRMRLSVPPYLAWSQTQITEAGWKEEEEILGTLAFHFREVGEPERQKKATPPEATVHVIVWKVCDLALAVVLQVIQLQIYLK